MENIDSFFLKKCQSITDWLQEWFGINNFKFAKLLLLMYLGTTLLMIGITLTNEGIKTTLEKELICFFVTPLVFTLLWRQTVLVENICNTMSFVNPLSQGNSNFPFLRVLVLVFSALIFPRITYPFLHVYPEDYKNFYEFFWTLRLLFFAFVFYFMACTPKKGKKSKVKKFIEKGQEKVASLLTPKPAFANS